MKHLVDIADVRAGFPFRGRVAPVPEGTLAVVQMKDVDSLCGLDPGSCIRILDEGARHGRHKLELGDVLMQSRGSKFPAVVIDKPLHGIAALGLFVIRPRVDVLPEYLGWILNQPRTRELLRGIARGTYVPFLSRTDLEALSVPVPPKDQQSRVVQVDILRRREKALSHQLEKQLDQYRDAVVWKAAVSTHRKRRK